MTPFDFLQWTAAPVIGWVIYVERRLSYLTAVKDSVDKIDAKVDRLVEHLLDHDK